MTNPEANTIVTVPKPFTVEMVKRPYPRVKEGTPDAPQSGVLEVYENSQLKLELECTRAD